MRPRRVVAAVMVLFAALALGHIFRHSPARVETDKSGAPAISLHGTTVVLRHKGAKQAEVHAERVVVSRDLRYARFEGKVRAVLYDKGDRSLELQTDQIVLDRHTNDLIMQRSLEITSPRGDHLVAPEARWFNLRQRLVFSRGVWMKIDNNEVQASRLRIDISLQTFDLEGNVDIIFRLGDHLP